MTEDYREQIDNLFAQLRLRLLEIRQANPETVEEMKSLVSQLEDCVERLVIDSLNLKRLQAEAETKRKTRSKKPQS